METATRAGGSSFYRLRSTALITILLLGALTLIWLDQAVAAALLVPIGLLAHALDRRDRQAQVLARRIADGRLGAKVEVPSGAWGELARAVNGLLQERRVERRLREALPEPLPLEAVQSLLGGDLLTEGNSRQVAVLLIGAPARAPAWERGVRRSGLAAWQTLARAVHVAAQRYGALLQPCGDAVVLVFGAFEERPARQSLRDALDAADLIQAHWQAGEEAATLSLALACGYALTVALPGLGFCVVGAPVEQAVGLQQLAARARRFGLMCSEEAYQALRRDTGAHTADGGPAWQPTDLRVSVANRPPQIVYRWSIPS
jgi:hypothetical protein